jgi:hypothetical protein
MDPARSRDARSGVDPGRVAQLHQRELARFAREHPRCLELRERARPVMPHGVPMQWMAASFAHPVWVTEGHGAHFTCADGRDFLDTNIGDKSTFCGFDPEPVVGGGGGGGRAPPPAPGCRTSCRPGACWKRS